MAEHCMQEVKINKAKINQLITELLGTPLKEGSLLPGEAFLVCRDSKNDWTIVKKGKPLDGTEGKTTPHPPEFL